MARTTFSVLALLVCGLAVLGAGADAIDEEPLERLTPWAGRWRLDRERSDRDESLMIALEVSWAMRKIAAIFTPTFAVRPKDGVIEFATDTPIGSRADRFHGDDVERDGEDLLGRSYRESSHWNSDGHLVVNRALQLDDSTAYIEIEWAVDDETLVSITTAKIGADPELRVRRVFERLKEGDS